jgi:hypothetical protein
VHNRGAEARHVPASVQQALKDVLLYINQKEKEKEKEKYM